MTDIRARLADALLAQFNMFPTLLNAKKLRIGLLSDHLADVLLSLPGIAIVDTGALLELADQLELRQREHAISAARDAYSRGAESAYRAAQLSIRQLLAAAVQAQEEQQ